MANTVSLLPQDSAMIIVELCGRLPQDVVSGGQAGLPRPPARPLAGDNHAAQEQFATPDPARLAALQRSGKAGRPQRALAA